jgi:abhydrolase domain-containing protein 17
MPRRPAMVLLSFLQVAVGAVALAYAALLILAWLGSDGMIFHPPPPGYTDGPELRRIPAADGVTLAALYLPHPAAKYLLVYCHGNAEDLGTLAPHLRNLRDRLGVSVLGWDYRGYGLSGGRPGAAATLRDAHAVMAYAAGTLGVPAERIILYGRSLGGGPAVEVAASQRVRGLILQSTFTSAFRVMTRVRILPFDKFVVLEKLPRVTCPVLVIHGTADRTVPFSHGLRNYAALPGPKYHLWVDGAGHNDLNAVAGDAYWRALGDFVARL